MPNFFPITEIVRPLLPRYDQHRIDTANTMTSTETINVPNPEQPPIPAPGVATDHAILITSSAMLAYYEEEILKYSIKRDDKNEDTIKTEIPEAQVGKSNAVDNPFKISTIPQSGDPLFIYSALSAPDYNGTAGTVIQTNRVSPNDEKDDHFGIDTERGKRYCCFKGRAHTVSTYLKNNWRTQASFFSKMMMTKTIQTVAILIWTYISMHSFEEALTINHMQIHYFILFILSVIKVSVLSCKEHCTRSELQRGTSYVAWLGLAMILEAVSIGTICASISLYYNITTLLIAIWILLFSYMLISIVPHATQSSISKWTNAVLELAVVFLVSIAVIAFKSVAVEKDYMRFFVTAWIPAVAIAEGIILVSFLWIRHVITGSAFNVHEKDWLYVAACV